jgi:hypothetical protein
MRYYRTEVRNTLNVPLRVIRFEAFVQQGGRWVGGNATGRYLFSYQQSADERKSQGRL